MNDLGVSQLTSIFVLYILPFLKVPRISQNKGQMYLKDIIYINQRYGVISFTLHSSWTGSHSSLMLVFIFLQLDVIYNGYNRFCFYIGIN